MPDNLYLITDGLPTQGGKATRGGTVTSAQRAALFRDAVDKLPRGVPINIILEPMEGDPIAASAFWRLAVATRGAFLAPRRLAMKIRRQRSEDTSISFLDVICCGFGAIVLLMRLPVPFRPLRWRTWKCRRKAC